MQLKYRPLSNFGRLSFRLAIHAAKFIYPHSRSLKSAGTLVIGLPIYNFNIPSVFKAWIDQVARAKVTFRYGDNGPEGLLEDKKAYVLLSSGGTLLGSDIDYVSDYIHHILGFIGIKDVTLIDSSGIGRNEEKVTADVHAVIDSI